MIQPGVIVPLPGGIRRRRPQERIVGPDLIGHFHLLFDERPDDGGHGLPLPRRFILNELVLRSAQVYLGANHRLAFCAAGNERLLQRSRLRLPPPVRLLLFTFMRLIYITMYIRQLVFFVSRYSMDSARAWRLASMMFSSTPTVPHSALPSLDWISTRVLAAVPVALSRIRTL